MSNELHGQKQAQEKQQTSNQAPKKKGEKEWEEEHKGTVEKTREREVRGREWESSDKAESQRLQGETVTKKDGGIKQCNQGKYQFWFEDESGKDGNCKNAGSLIMRVAIPKYLSTSLVDVDIHPTYVSVVIKSKILRVVLPVEILSDKSVARRSAASGYLELVMPKVDPNAIAIGLGHVRDHGKDRKAMKELGSDYNQSTAKETESKENATQKKREHLGQSLMKEARMIDSLKIIQNQGLEVKNSVLSNCDEDDNDDGPPPLY
mmetsp:Transcript_19530/g.42430  ORF Transcript_19530/g.42430 Transcript_19530/m.42430 type:complete len:263 (-) Transcript_19530:170-958(-)